MGVECWVGVPGLSESVNCFCCHFYRYLIEVDSKNETDQRKGEIMYRKIMVAYDGSPYSNKALSAGMELTRRCGCELHAVAVMNLPDYAGTVQK
jgi:hypothetical protein